MNITAQLLKFFQHVTDMCLILLIWWSLTTEAKLKSCEGGHGLKYAFGDALSDTADCLGPDGFPYPSKEINRILSSSHSRQARSGFGLFSSASHAGIQSPDKTREQLLQVYAMSKRGIDGISAIHSSSSSRSKREVMHDANLPAPNLTTTEGTVPSQCVPPIRSQDGGSESGLKMEVPARLCRSTYNTTAPMYGVSLTSGKPVRIVQKFPDLLQQVVYETCQSNECDLMHGECVQSYMPYLFLVIPLGPVTLTGQDYILVESGCACRPKYAQSGSDPNPKSIIQNFGSG